MKQIFKNILDYILIIDISIIPIILILGASFGLTGLIIKGICWAIFLEIGIWCVAYIGTYRQYIWWYEIC